MVFALKWILLLFFAHRCNRLPVFFVQNGPETRRHKEEVGVYKSVRVPAGAISIAYQSTAEK